MMNIQKLKKYALTLALSSGFLVAPALTSSVSDVQAQGWGFPQNRRDDRWDRRDDRWDRRDDWRQRQRERERAEWLRRQRNGGHYGNNGGYYGNNGGYYGNNGGYYGNNGGYYGNSREEQKGFRDGLTRGQEDLRDRRRFDPNNSSHYRKGSSDYREGFRRGYVQGYRQNGYNRW